VDEGIPPTGRFRRRRNRSKEIGAGASHDLVRDAGAAEIYLIVQLPFPLVTPQPVAHVADAVSPEPPVQLAPVAGPSEPSGLTGFCGVHEPPSTESV
jgi:hypothetical protein